MEAPKRVTEQIVELNSNSRFRSITPQTTNHPIIPVVRPATNPRRIVPPHSKNFLTPFQEELDESIFDSLENTAQGNKETNTLVLNQPPHDAAFSDNYGANIDIESQLIQEQEILI